MGWERGKHMTVCKGKTKRGQDEAPALCIRNVDSCMHHVRRALSVLVGIQWLLTHVHQQHLQHNNMFIVRMEPSSRQMLSVASSREVVGATRTEPQGRIKVGTRGSGLERLLCSTSATGLDRQVSIRIENNHATTSSISILNLRSSWLDRPMVD